MLAFLIQEAPLFPPELHEKYLRHYTYLAYGMIAAWLVLLVFVIMLLARERKLQRELDRLRLMIDEKGHH